MRCHAVPTGEFTGVGREVAQDWNDDCATADMRPTRLRTGTALVVVAALAGLAAAQSSGDDLDVLTAKARFATAHRSGTSKHRIKLSMRVTPRQLPYQHDGEQHGLAVVLDGVTLCDAASGADGYRVRKNGRWSYRGDIAGGRVRMTGDGRSGKVKLEVSGAHLPELRDGDAEDLLLELQLAGTQHERSVSFFVVDGRVRRWAGIRVRFPPPDPDPDPGPGPGPGPGDPPPTGAALKAAIVADMERRGVAYTSGSGTPAGGFDAQTLRCPSGQLAEVVQLAVPLPGSADMFTDTAYFCRGSRQYWAHREGGFAGFNLWIGPFTLP